MTGEVVREGWLQKAPSKWRMNVFNLLPAIGGRWNHRYFVLCSGALPGACRLMHYTDESKLKLCGEINLDECSQVDSYLTCESRGARTYQWIFDVRTAARTLFLAATDEREMVDWVRHLCAVCQLERDDAPGGEPGVLSPHEMIIVRPTRQPNAYDSTPAGREHERMHFNFDHCRHPRPHASLDDVPPPAPSTNGRLHPTLPPKPDECPAAPVAEPQQYTHLKNAISAAPRPGRPPGGRAPPPRRLDAPAEPQPYEQPATVHRRGASSESNSSGARRSTASDTDSAGNARAAGGLDAVPPPPRPPKSTARLHKQPVAASYTNEEQQSTPLVDGYDAPRPVGAPPPPPPRDHPPLPAQISLEQFPPPPPPPAFPAEEHAAYDSPVQRETRLESDETDDDAFAAHTIDLYHNLKPMPPAVNRRLKPHRPGDVGFNIEKRESFVRKAASPPQPQHEKVSVPQFLPPTSKSKAQGGAVSPPSNGVSAASSAVQYVDVEAAVARSPSPDAEGSPTRSLAATAPTSYVDIDPMATKALGEVLPEHERLRGTLDRGKKKH